MGKMRIYVKRRNKAAKTGPVISRKKLWLFRLLMMSVVILLFTGVEFSLRVMEYGFPSSFTLPLEIQEIPHRIENKRFGYLFFPPALARVPHVLAYPEEKPEDAIRIFIMGGSAAYGDPEPSYGFSRILEVMLRDRFPGQKIEVINSAMTATNSHVARWVADECVHHDPDLMIVYSGNNEVVGPYGAGNPMIPLAPSLKLIRASLFVKSLRTGQLIRNGMGLFRSAAQGPEVWRGMELFMDNQVRHDSPQLARVYDFYRKNLEAIIRAASKNKVPVLLCTVGVNLIDCPPFASSHQENLGEEDLHQWGVYYNQGVDAQKKSNLSAALSAYEKAADIDPHFAELRYRQAQCQKELGLLEEAGFNYRRALNLDTLRFRADTVINQSIREVVQKAGQNCHLVDVEKFYQQTSPEGFVGENLFLDHVHMNFKGNYLAAREMCLPVTTAVPELAGLKMSQRWLNEQEAAERLVYNDYARHEVTSIMLQRFQEPPFNQQMGHQARLQRWRDYLKELNISTRLDVLENTYLGYRQAVEQDQVSVMLRMDYATFLMEVLNAPGQAGKQYRIVLEHMPHHWAARTGLGLALAAQGRLADAETQLRQAVSQAPRETDALSGLGMVLQMAGKDEEGLDYLLQALEINPEYVTGYYRLGMYYTGQGDAAEAEEQFRKALEISPEYWQAAFALGQLMMESKRYEDAEEVYRRIISRMPRQTEALEGLGQSLMRQNKLEAAIDTFQKLVSLDPATPNYHYSLAQAYFMADQKQRGMESLRDALKAAPGWPPAALNLAEMLLMRPERTGEDLEEAIRLAEQGIYNQRQPDAHSLDLLARAYAAAGRYEDAVAAASEALKLAQSRNMNSLASEISRRLNVYRSATTGQ